MATLASGTPIRMDALKHGDAIVAATRDGTTSVDTVSLFSVSHPEERAAYLLNLTIGGALSLLLTPMHHISVGDQVSTSA